MQDTLGPTVLAQGLLEEEAEGDELAFAGVLEGLLQH